MQSYASGAKAVVDAEQSSQDYQSLIGSKQDLKTAYEQETKPDPETGKPTTADPFKVQNLAAQFAASRGDLKSFELFNKQAQTFKQGNLVNQLKELEIQNDGIEKAHQSFMMMETPADGLKELTRIDNPMPLPQKLAMINKLKQLEKQGPEAFNKYKDEVSMAILPAKERVKAQIEIIKAENEKLVKDAENNRKLLQDKETVRYHDGILNAKNNKDGGSSKAEKDSLHDEKVNDKIDDETDKKRAEIRKINGNMSLSPESKKQQIAEIETDYEKRVAELKGRIRNKPPAKPEPEPFNFDIKALGDISPNDKKKFIENVDKDGYGDAFKQSFDKRYGVGAAKAVIDEHRAKPKGSWLGTIFEGTSTHKEKLTPEEKTDRLKARVEKRISDKTTSDEKKKKLYDDLDNFKKDIIEKNNKNQLDSESKKSKQNEERLKRIEESSQKVQQAKEERIADAKVKIDELQFKLQTAKEKGDTPRIKSLEKQISLLTKQLN